MKKAAPATPPPVEPKDDAAAPETDQATDPATITPDANENPAADDSGADSTPTVPPAGPPTDDSGDSEGNDDADGSDDDDGNVQSKSDLDETDFRKAWIDYAHEKGIRFPDGHVLFPGEPLTFEGNKVRGNVVEFAEDVYRLVLPFRSKRPTFTLVARKGTLLTKARFLPKDEYRGAIGDLAVPSIEG